MVRPGDPDSNGPCANINPSDDFLIVRLRPNYRHVEIQPAICLEQLVRYEMRIYFGEQRKGYPDPRSTALIDSLVIVPPTDSLDLFKGSPKAEYLKQVRSLSALLRRSPSGRRSTATTPAPYRASATSAEASATANRMWWGGGVTDAQ